MPNLGEITTRNKIGLTGRSKMIWAACPICGTARWTMYSLYRKTNGKALCRSCSGQQQTKRLVQWRKAGSHRPDCKCTTCSPKDQWGKDNPSWNGGCRKHQDGYVYVLVDESDPMRCMGGRDRYVLEHRLAVARELGRPLYKWELIHHINGDRADNRLDNLELWIKNHPSGVRLEDYRPLFCRTCKEREMRDE